MKLFFYFNLCIINAFSTKRYIPKSNLAIFGVTGKTGQCVLNQALSMNKGVYSLVRPKNKLNLESNDFHTIYKGDVSCFEDVKQVYNGNVISGTIICLGGATSEVGKSMLTDGTRNIIQCIKESKIASNRIAIVTSIGAGDSVDEPPLFFQILMKTVLKDAFIDKNNQEALFLDDKGIGSGLEFVIVRPSGLTDDYLKKISIINKGSGTIPRMSVADFLINAIYDKTFPYINSAVCITSQEKETSGEPFVPKI